MRIPRQFTAAHAQTLRAQAFDDLSPGPVLHDFQVLLDFLGTGGVKAAGKYNLLPIDAISVLDERLAHPLRLALKRPQLRSHPYLQGLHLLLRASGIAAVTGSGDKTRLTLAPAAWERWQSLNPAERYFALLEAWMLLGEPEMLGEREGGYSDFLCQCVVEWRHTPPAGRILGTGGGRPDMVYLRGIRRDFYLLALMDLFGWIRVQHYPVPPQPWMPVGFSRTPFGDALCTLLADRHYPLVFAGFTADGDQLELEPPEEAEQAATGEADDEQDDTAESMSWFQLRETRPGFGFWKPLFQPYIPAWQQTLAGAAPVPKTGEFLFRVTLGKTQRDIALPDDATLDNLVHWILRSVNFDDDHLYELSYRDHLGRSVKVLHPACDEGPFGDEICIGELPLEPGGTMQLWYDFGDSWRFQIRLERIEAAGSKKRGPRIVARHGAAPKQYGDNW